MTSVLGTWIHSAYMAPFFSAADSICPISASHSNKRENI